MATGRAYQMVRSAAPSLDGAVSDDEAQLHGLRGGDDESISRTFEQSRGRRASVIAWGIADSG
jgi:hypothetical protein